MATPVAQDLLIPAAPADQPSLLGYTGGQLTAEELAALTVVLLARAAGPSAPRYAHGNRVVASRARWQRLERRSGYHSPASWH